MGGVKSFSCQTKLRLCYVELWLSGCFDNKNLPKRRYQVQGFVILGVLLFVRPGSSSKFAGLSSEKEFCRKLQENKIYEPSMLLLESKNDFCPALTKLSLDLHVNFCLYVCLSVCVFGLFSRRLIG